MQKNRRYAILTFLILAILVSVLYNMRIFLWVLEYGFTDEGRPKLYYMLFNFIIEFAVFFLVGLLNYSWIVSMIHRFSIRRGKLPFIALCNLLVYFILIPAGKLFHTWYFLDKYENKEIEFDIENFLIINITVFLLAIVVANLLLLMKKMKISEQENLRLAEEKSRAELSALKEQISPHFFFNTLSTLSSIVRNEKKEVGLEFIGEMSKTYRYTLNTNKDLVTLAAELDFIDAYLYLLKKRYGEKFIVIKEVPEEHLQKKIPPLALQMLVENVIQHNELITSSPLIMRIYIEDEMICVENNLQEKVAIESSGIGLKNLDERFRLLSTKEIRIFKDNHHFCVKLPLLYD